MSAMNRDKWFCGSHSSSDGGTNITADGSNARNRLFTPAPATTPSATTRKSDDVFKFGTTNPRS